MLMLTFNIMQVELIIVQYAYAHINTTLHYTCTINFKLWVGTLDLELSYNDSTQCLCQCTVTLHYPIITILLLYLKVTAAVQ